MGLPKLGLPIGSSTVLGCLIATLHQAGIHSVLVVLAPGEDRLATLASQSGAIAVHLPAPTPHMRATVNYGLIICSKRQSKGGRFPAHSC